jgi:hypothetical protein
LSRFGKGQKLGIGSHGLTGFYRRAEFIHNDLNEIAVLDLYIRLRYDVYTSEAKPYDSDNDINPAGHGPGG